MNEEEKAILGFLSTYISEHKKNRIEEVLSYRTRHITLLLENIYYSQNASAVIRTSDCFGIQDLHIVEDTFDFKINPHVVRGAAKWMDFHRYPSTPKAIDSLRSKGYKIAATTPHAKAMTIDEIPLENPVALVFGTEQDGLSNEGIQQAEYQVRIPMFGFTESFNISVSAAICLTTLVNRLHESEIAWQLSDEEKEATRLAWYRKTVNRSELLEKRFLADKGDI